MINWIKTSEKLPEAYKEVLLYAEGIKGFEKGFLTDYEYYGTSEGDYITWDITHWAELSDINLPE
jgi:hypothetical protein